MHGAGFFKEGLRALQVEVGGARLRLRADHDAAERLLADVGGDGLGLADDEVPTAAHAQVALIVVGDVVAVVPWGAIVLILEVGARAPLRA